MDFSHITVDQALASLEKAVEAKGRDYVYPHRYCTYISEDGTPACIVGHVFDDIGVFEVPAFIDDGTVDEVNLNCHLNLRNEVEYVLMAAQTAQDGVHAPRKTWGEALDLARAAAKDLENSSS